MPLERRHLGYLASVGLLEVPFEYPQKPVPMADPEEAPAHECPNDGPDLSQKSQLTTTFRHCKQKASLSYSVHQPCFTSKSLFQSGSNFVIGRVGG